MLDLFLSQTQILQELGGIWIVGLLVFTRVLAFASMAPLIGHKSIPGLVKISFAILLTLLIIPSLQVPSEYPKDFYFVYLIAFNALIGLFIGWISQLVIEICRAAGEMLDMQMGLNAATLFDPGTQTQSTIIGRFFDFIALVIFISIGGMEKVITGLYKSFEKFPIVLSEFDINFFKVLHATSDVIGMSFVIVSPIIITILVVDLILGLMSRAAPQINAFQISFSIKPALGLILMLLLLPALLQIFAGLFSNPLKFF